MAQETITILKVGTEEAVKNLNDLKNNVKILKEQLGELEIGTEDYQNKLEELKINQNAVKDAMYATTASMEDLSASATGTAESYNSLVHRMAALKEELRATDVSTEAGKQRFAELAAQINETNTKLKEMDAAQGNFQRNVGNYPKAVSIIGQLGSAFQATAGKAGAIINPVKNVTSGLTAMSATPVVAIMGLLANVLTKVIGSLKSSEENINRITIAMSPFNSISTAATKAMQWLGDKVADVAEWLGKMLDKLGLVKEEMKVQQEITKEEIALKQRQREVDRANADDQLEISKLKAAAAEKDKYTAKERLEFIEQAAEKERAIADRNIEIARREYDVLERKSQLAGNSAAENDELTAAYVRLQQAEGDYFNKTKELNAQRVEAINSIKSETKAVKELAAATGEEIIEEEELLSEYEKEWQAKKERESLIDGLIEQDKERAEAREAYNQRVIESEEYMQSELERIAKENEEAEKERWKNRVEITTTSMAAISSIFGSLADIYENNTDASEEELRKSKNLRIAGATIDMLSGVVAAISTAMELGPILGPIMGGVNSAAVIAAGVANISKIKQQSTSANSAAASVAPTLSVSAPIIPTSIPEVRSITSATEEDRLNRMASNRRVVLVTSDLELKQEDERVRVAEASF